ncbi:uncharacterized protein LAJ45_07740 [Morchella importuna]|uniref:uncharacterized protein n=1 Tax=Morchella importuna TaxID=1174673 RepID=UPI001E8D5835|nr:uncharacterized protein LAJ45_07740 [Morchella importuna]KAH8148287.1 hypothetical protein LAJ45_07740 [Morchella importuna]
MSKVAENSKGYPGRDSRDILGALASAFKSPAAHTTSPAAPTTVLTAPGKLGSSPPPPPAPVRRAVLAVRSTAPAATVSASQRAPKTATRPPRWLPIQSSVAGPSRALDTPSPVEQRRSSRARAPETPPSAQVAYRSAPEASPTAQGQFRMTQANKAKMTLGLLNLPKVYTNIHNSLKAQMQNVGWVNKSVSGAAAFDALCLYLMNLRSLRAFLPIWTGVDSEARRALADALKWLIGDVGQKEKLSRGQGNREYREAAGDNDDDDDGGQPAQRSRKRKRDPVSADLDRPSIMVTVVDPDALGAFFNVVLPPTYDWNDPQNEPLFIGILTKITFPELCNLILKHTAPGRAIRSIWGALDNVPPASNPPVRPMEVQIIDSEEVEGWLKNSVGRPRRILAVLHRAGAGANLGGAESPPLNRALPHIEEDDYTMIDIPAEDSDYEEGSHRINAKGLRVYLPRTDASNQRLIQTLVRRRDRQQV